MLPEWLVIALLNKWLFMALSDEGRSTVRIIIIVVAVHTEEWWHFVSI